METLGQTLTDVQKLANEFTGSTSIKNASRKYFFVNDNWLAQVGFERNNVIGKRDEDLFPQNISDNAKTSDLKALENKVPIEYELDIIIGEKPISAIIIKWAIFHSTGEPFCIITIGDLKERKEQMLIFREKVLALFAR